MLKRLHLLILTFLSVNLYAQTSLTFSIQAHQDDWQLFMSSRIVADLTAGGKVVFITLTAGDGGQGAGGYSTSGIPYYTGRENGSIYASKYAYDITHPAIVPTAVPTGSLTPVNGHNILKYSYAGGLVVNYFLHLPDGNGDGTGFTNTGNKSIEKLKKATITTIAAVDGSATYISWTDLTNTIRAIINAEKIVGKNAWIYTADATLTPVANGGDNTVYNPNDHSDHRYSAYAAYVAITTVPAFAWVGMNGFMDYESSGAGANLSNTDHENASGIFSMCTFGLTEAGYHNDFMASHKAWLPMDYFQLKFMPVGTARPVGGITPPAEVPFIMSVTSPASAGKDITVNISPFETGELITTIYDMAGNKVNQVTTKVESKDALLVTLKNGAAAKGAYRLEALLNNQYIETRKIDVQ